MPQTTREKRRHALYRADLWLQEMVRQGAILSDFEYKDDREFVRRINEWTRVLLEHDRKEIPNG